ncbi:MAG: hypothetical protein OEZ34_02700 [Spirochaetia bacterium]|nr:hypothetical protein [Spirochaetia bacterium]
MKLLDMITVNWKIKLGSFATALFLFWYVQYSRNITRVLNIRVNRPEIPSEYVLASRVPSFIPVKFYGMYDIIDFNVSDFRINLVNHNIQQGENIYQPELVPDLPDEIKADFQEEEIVIKLDRELKRKVFIDPVYEIRTGKNYRRGYLRITPPALTIKGPYGIISGDIKLRTEPMILEEKGSVRTGKGKLLALPEFVSLAEEFTGDVELSVRLLEKDHLDEGEMQIDNIPIRCLNPIPGLKMKSYGSETASVRILPQGQKVKESDISLGVYCPVFYDDTAKEIKPSYIIDDVHIIAEGKTISVEILEVIPEKVNLQFEIIQKSIPPAIQKGFKEHIIP